MIDDRESHRHLIANVKEQEAVYNLVIQFKLQPCLGVLIVLLILALANLFSAVRGGEIGRFPERISGCLQYQCMQPRSTTPCFSSQPPHQNTNRVPIGEICNPTS